MRGKVVTTPRTPPVPTATTLGLPKGGDSDGSGGEGGDGGGESFDIEIIDRKGGRQMSCRATAGWSVAQLAEPWAVLPFCTLGHYFAAINRHSLNIQTSGLRRNDRLRNDRLKRTVHEQHPELGYLPARQRLFLQAQPGHGHGASGGLVSGMPVINAKRLVLGWKKAHGKHELKDGATLAAGGVHSGSQLTVCRGAWLIALGRF